MAGDNRPAAVSEEVIREHAEGWHEFTRFMTIGIIAVVLLLIAFALQFAVGWGFSMFLLFISYVVLALMAALRKV
ncbi:MAG TPA: hypothetical protein VEB20_14405 [Azospirillaceae bacterium]|nr:hypothetical protein [Azospirillaceae bacterium]